jgi:hypothetical protein
MGMFLLLHHLQLLLDMLLMEKLKVYYNDNRLLHLHHPYNNLHLLHLLLLNNQQTFVHCVM